jgi:PTS system ascorbate-specific IIC component
MRRELAMVQDILQGLADNLLSQVPILIGLIALLGLLLQRKPIEDVVGGTVRAALGDVILTWTGGRWSAPAR